MSVVNAGPDVIDHLEQRLAQLRRANAAGYDREQALVELRSIAIEDATGLNQLHLSAEQLWASPTSPEEHARLRSIVDRALESDDPEEVAS